MTTVLPWRALLEDWKSTVGVDPWVSNQQLPEIMQHRGLDAPAAEMLSTLWQHLIDELDAGMSCSPRELGREIRLGRIFRFYVDDATGAVDACHIDPNCGPRWYEFDVLHPVSLRLWVNRVLNAKHRLQDEFAEFLVAAGWKRYPDSGKEIDWSSATQIAGSIFAWVENVIRKRLRAARLSQMLNRAVLAELRLDPSLIRIALRARPAHAGPQRLSRVWWNEVVRHRYYFEPLARYMPEALPELGGLIHGQPEVEWAPAAQRLVQCAKGNTSS